jgi:hypothetical protein
MTARPYTGFSLEATIKDVTRAYLQTTGIDIAFLRNPRFVDYSRKDFLMQRGKRTYVDPVWDARDGFLMTEWARDVKHAKGFGRGYQRLHFCRAFAGCSSEDVRKEGV